VYVSELENENKIQKIDSKYYLSPPSQELLDKVEQNSKIKEFLRIHQKNLQLVGKLFDKIKRLEKNQPLKAKIIQQKLKISPDFEIMNEITSFVNNYNSNKITKESIKDFFEKSNKFLKSSLTFFDEWSLRFQLVPRFEYPKFKDNYTNPYGIQKRFRKKDGGINYDKIERVYRFKIFLGCCPNCGEYVANNFNRVFNAVKQLKKGKITLVEYNKIVKKCKMHDLLYKVIQEKETCPRDFMLDGKALPKDLLRIN